MKAFIWTVVVMLIIEMCGKAVMLMQRDYIRKPPAMVLDIVLGSVMLVWAAWLLGNSA